jgi:predicted 2-oxoglutarate/Fe(II)-dependent dioxygenase YbiX
VLYLNDQGANFQGGSLLFKEGEPRAVAPRAGRLAAYGSGEADAHGVEPVARGVRHTLTVWLTDDPAHSEDRKAGGGSREGWP